MRRLVVGLATLALLVAFMPSAALAGKPAAPVINKIEVRGVSSYGTTQCQVSITATYSTYRGVAYVGFNMRPDAGVYGQMIRVTPERKTTSAAWYYMVDLARGYTWSASLLNHSRFIVDTHETSGYVFTASCPTNGQLIASYTRPA